MRHVAEYRGLARLGSRTATPGRDAVYGGVGFTLRVGETLGFNANYNIDFGREHFFNNMVSGGLNFSF